MGFHHNVNKLHVKHLIKVWDFAQIPDVIHLMKVLESLYWRYTTAETRKSYLLD